MLNLGIDVGGTKIEAGLVDLETGKILKNVLFNLPDSGDREILLSIFKQIIDSFDLNGIKNIGVGFPSNLINDYKPGITYVEKNHKPKLRGLHNFNLVAFLENYSKKKVVMNNDASCFALGEFRYGKLSGNGKLLGLIIGTGFGSSTVSNNILKNEKFANIPYKNGEAEDYISSRGLLKISKELVFVFRTPEEITVSAKKDGNGIKVYRQFGSILGEIISPFVSGNNYNCIVIGGSVGIKGFDYFIPNLSTTLSKNLLICRSELKNAGIVGAAYLPSFSGIAGI